MNLVFAPKDKWEVIVSKKIFETINKENINKKIELMFTGGRTANDLYKYLSKDFIRVKNCLNIYFTDERCVSLNSKENNFHNIKKNLYNNIVPQHHTLFRIKADNKNWKNEANRYEKLLPKHLDLLLLSLGTDGHIASIFRGGEAMHTLNKKVKPIIAPIYPKNRITITHNVIKLSKNKILLVKGKEKGKILRQLLENQKKDGHVMPAILITEGDIIVDSEAQKEI